MRVLRLCSANRLVLALTILLLACLAIPALAQPQAEAGAAPAPLEVQLEAPAWAAAWLTASEAALLVAAVDGPDTGKQALPEATATLQAYLDQGRGDPRLYGLLGQLYLRRGLPSRALTYFERAIPSAQYSSDPAAAQQAKPRLAGVLADYYLCRAGLSATPAAARAKLRDVAAALPQLEADVASQPAALYIRSEAARLSGDYTAYTQALGQLLALSANSPLPPLAQGRYLLELGNATQAAAQFQAALERDHGLADAWLGLAEARRLLENTDGAKVALASARDCAGGRLDVLAAVGAQRLLLGDGAGAEEAFRLILANVPEDSDVLAALGRAYLAAGNAAAAAGYFTRAAADGGHPLLGYELARAHLANGDTAAAADALAPARTALPQDPAVLLAAAQLAAAQGQAPVARANLQQASAGSFLIDADLAFAQYLSELQDSGAAEAWEALVAEHHDNPQAWLARARQRLADGAAADAAADCGQAAALAPSCDVAQALWAEALIAGGATAEAAKHYDNALALDPTPELYLAAIKLATATPALAGKLDGYWAALLKAYPQHTAVLLADGERLLDNGSYSAAAAALGRAAVVLPDDPRVLAKYGAALAGAGETASALAQFKRSLDLAYDPAVAAELASALVAAGQTDEAARLWNDLLLDNPDDAGLAMQYGLTLFNTGDYGGALEQYLRGAQLDPANDQFHNRAGLCLFKLGRIGEALSEVLAALQLRDDPQYYLNLAVGYEQLSDVTNAEKFYRTGLERYPAHAELQRGYTDFLVRQGQTAGALQRLWDAAIAADDPELYQRIYSLALQVSDPYTAEQACLARLRLAPGDPAALQDYCLLLSDTRRWDDLKAYLAQVATQVPAQTFLELLRNMTSDWLARQKTVDALAMLDALSALDPRREAYYAAIAWLRLGSEDYTGALDIVKRGLNDAGRGYTLRYQEAFLTAQLSGAAAALPLAQALLDDPAADIAAYALYAQLLGQNNQFTEQTAVLLDGLAAFPAATQLFEQLAHAYYAAQDYEAARQLLEDPVFKHLVLPGREELLGRCYLDDGNYVKAAGLLQQAAQAAQTDAALWSALGEARYFLGELDGARTALTQALDLDGAFAGANVWLCYVLLDQKDAAGAGTALAAAQAGNPDRTASAWLALAQARLALASGDRAGAQQALDRALSFSVQLPRFTELYERTRREAGLVN